MTDILNYPQMIDNAMRSVVRDALRQVQKSGLPGEHHFYISFNTNFPGVKISETLKVKYPKEITIVLQHQFWDFKVDDDQFQVTLSFSGMPEKLVVPYAALTAFADPSTKFGLQFQQSDMFESGANDAEDPISVSMNTDALVASASAEVISLDSFRKK